MESVTSAKGEKQMVKLGDKIRIWPKTISAYEEREDRRRKKIRMAPRGTVVYIHPLRRFCVLEFKVRGGVIRESFMLMHASRAMNRVCPNPHYSVKTPMLKPAKT